MEANVEQLTSDNTALAENLVRVDERLQQQQLQFAGISQNFQPRDANALRDYERNIEAWSNQSSVDRERLESIRLRPVAPELLNPQ